MASSLSAFGKLGHADLVAATGARRLVDHKGAGDREHPRAGQCGLLGEDSRAPPGAQEGLLHDVVGTGRVAGEVDDVTPHRRAVRVVERDQAAVVIGGHSSPPAFTTRWRRRSGSDADRHDGEPSAGPASCSRHGRLGPRPDGCGGRPPIGGLRLHPLIVHAVVVLTPLTVLALLLGAFWPAARRRLGVVTALGGAGRARVGAHHRRGREVARRRARPMPAVERHRGARRDAAPG